MAPAELQKMTFACSDNEKFGSNITCAAVWECEKLGESCLALNHKSGLRILISQKKKSTVCGVLAVRYGSIDTDVARCGEDECPTPYGVAHFLEHQMFTKPDGGDWQEDFSALGAEVNAYTAYDRTAYTFSCTHGYTDALRLLLQMVSAPRFDKRSVKKERGIIIEELRMNADSPWERAYSELLKIMYPTHPVRVDICGNEKSIKRITPEILYTCHERFYLPDNMVLSVCGDVDVDEIIKLCDELVVKGNNATSASPRRIFDGDGQMTAQYTEVSVPSRKPTFCIGIKDTSQTPRGRELLRRDATLSVLGEMLFSRTAPFYNSLLEDGLISPDFSMGTSLGDGFCFISIMGEADQPHRVFEKFKQYVASIRQNGLSQKDFLRNRRILYADFVTAFDTTEDIANTMMNYAIDNLSPFDFIDTVKEMTFDDVKTLFDAMLKEENYALSVAMPTERD